MNTHSVTILIVDDDDAVRKSLLRYLQDLDYQAAGAATVDQALNCLNEYQPKIAIVDMRLAGSSGETLILTAHAIQPQLRFMVYTGSNTFEVSPALKRIGIREEHVLRKPVENLTVIKTVIDDLLHEIEGADS